MNSVVTEAEKLVKEFAPYRTLWERHPEAFSLNAEAASCFYDRLTASIARAKELEAAARALLKALDTALPVINQTIILEATRTGGQGYTGPSFTEEMEALRALVEPAEELEREIADIAAEHELSAAEYKRRFRSHFD